jgi:hypothetical protein
MKPGRPLLLLTGVALLGAIARFNEMTLDARASLFDAAGESARGTAASLLQSAVATHHAVTDKMMGVAQERPARVLAPPQAEGREVGEVPSQRMVARTADAESPAPAGNPLWALPLKQLSITLERPIFSPSRRPPPTPTYIAPVVVRQPVKPPKLEHPAVSLLGTIIGTDVQIGVFRETATKNVVRLRVGEGHQGWVLSLIEVREVTLVKGEQAVVLELSPPGEAPAPGDSTVPPPVLNGLPGVATGTIPIVSNANYVDEQPVPAMGARRQGH